MCRESKGSVGSCLNRYAGGGLRCRPTNALRGHTRAVTLPWASVRVPDTVRAWFAHRFQNPAGNNENANGCHCNRSANRCARRTITRAWNNEEDRGRKCQNPSLVLECKSVRIRDVQIRAYLERANRCAARWDNLYAEVDAEAVNSSPIGVDCGPSSVVTRHAARRRRSSAAGARRTPSSRGRASGRRR